MCLFLEQIQYAPFFLSSSSKGILLFVEIQQDDELSENQSTSLSGPTGYFRCKSIFRHDDHISEVAVCYLWMVGQVGKIDGFLFLYILGEVYL